MKNNLLRDFGAVFAATSFLLTAHFLTAQTITDENLSSIIPPEIVTQPLDQTANYGDDASFTVEASGTSLRFQWQKNGLNLADYGNVFGANSSTLKLVGIAQIDEASYTVVISNKGGAVTSSVITLVVNSTTVFRDDFESGDLKNWTPFSETGSLSISADQNHTGNGSRSALLTNSMSKMYRNLGTKIAGRVKATFWIYDDGGPGMRSYGELRGYTGPGHTTYGPPGGLKQLFAIGRYAVRFGPKNIGTLADEIVNEKKYQGKVERGKNTGWFNLDAPGAPDRSIGWHKFEIVRDADGTNVHFYVDGVLGRTITGADHILLDCVAIGSIGGGTAVGDAWFDDVKVEAFPWRFEWQSKDSEGKGLFDWMKLRETGTDPVVTDIKQIATVSAVTGSATNNRLGQWTNNGDAIHALDMRGFVEYVVNAPADDAYRIEVEGRERDGKTPTVQLPLIISIDGENLGRFILPYAGRTNGVVHCFTPLIKAGLHTIRVNWDNAQSKCSLYLQGVRLQSLVGADANNNGIKDWVENRVLAQSEIEFAPAASSTSPVCVEGRGQYLSMMQCSAGVSDAEMQAVAIQPGAGHRWYANVPLSPDRTTRIEVSYQNGALKETRDIAWEVTNLLKANDATIRKGDSLLLTAVPDNRTNGTVRITIVGVTNYVTDATTPIPHRFDQAGTFTVMGIFEPTTTSRLITVKVVEASFNGSVAAWANKRRFWDCANLAPEVVLDADPRLKMVQVTESEHSLQIPAPPPLGINSRQYSLVNDAAEPRVVLARLGAKGPVLASTTVNGFRLFNCYNTYLRYVHIYSDQSQLIEEAFVVSPSLFDVAVKVKVIVSGVTFDDGTVTKTLSASDFDALGVCRVRYIRAAGIKTSVCHTSKAYQGDALIGWPAYEK